MKITSDEIDRSLIDFQANRSQLSTGRPVFLREWLLAYRLKTIPLCRTCILIVDSNERHRCEIGAMDASAEMRVCYNSDASIRERQEEVESNREVVSRCHSFVALAVVYCSTDLALLGRPYLSPTGNFFFVKRSTLLVTWSLGCLKFFPVFQSQRHLTQSLPFWIWNSNH